MPRISKPKHQSCRKPNYPPVGKQKTALINSSVGNTNQGLRSADWFRIQRHTQSNSRQSRTIRKFVARIWEALWFLDCEKEKNPSPKTYMPCRFFGWGMLDERFSGGFHCAQPALRPFVRRRSERFCRALNP